MRDKKQLVLRRPHVQPTPDREKNRRDGRHSAPDPPIQLGIPGVDLQPDNRVDDHVQHKHPRHPAVQQQIRRVRPVGQPEEDVIARGEEEDEREEHEGEGAGAVEDVGRDLVPLRREPGVGLAGLVADGGEDDGEGEEDGEVEGLTDGRGVAEEEGKGLDLVAADEGGVDEVGVELCVGGSLMSMSCVGDGGGRLTLSKTPPTNGMYPSHIKTMGSPTAVTKITILRAKQSSQQQTPSNNPPT